MHNCMFNYQRAKLKKKTRKTKQSMTSKIKEVFWPKSATKIYDFCKSCKQLRDTAIIKCKFYFEQKKSHKKNIQKKSVEMG